ncbi:MAG: type VII secretion protein EssC [Eubacterium sp.]|nr:type VII secretion protein EssC [Eubacterium sp.]
MKKYILYLNEENNILEYMLPGDDNRQGTLDLSSEMDIKGLILSYEVWDGRWYIKTNDYVRVSVENMVMLSLELEEGTVFNIKIKSSERRLTGMIRVIDDSMMAFRKYDISRAGEITIGSAPESVIRIKQNFVSRTHATMRRRGDGWYITDQSKNGTFLNSRRINGEAKLSSGDVIFTLGYKIVFLGSFIAINQMDKVEVKLSALNVNDVADNTVYEDRGEFSRSPRFIEPLDESDVEIEGPPQPEKPNKTPLFLILGPSLTMPLPILMTVIVNATLNKNGGGPVAYVGMMISVVMFAVIGVMWGLIRHRYDAKAKITTEKERVTAYSRYILQNDEFLLKKLEKNKGILTSRYKSSSELASLIPGDSMQLWNRNVHHEDFLTIRLGMGFIKSPVAVKIPKQRFSVTQDNLQELPQQVYDKFEYIGDTVKTLDLRRHKIIGVIGHRRGMNDVLTNMVVQIGALHSYTDVKMAFLSRDQKDIEWVKWMPHTFSNDKKVRFIGCDNESIQNTIYALTNELRFRAEQKAEKGDNLIWRNRFVVFCTDRTIFENETVYKYIVSDEDLGFTFVMLYGSVNDLPNECNFIIENSRDYSGVYILDQPYDVTRNITFDIITRNAAESFARYISGLTVSEMAEGQIPDNVDYFEMMGIGKLEDYDLIKNYKANRSYEGLPSMVGLSAGGKPLFLDIHEKKYGPHGLVAGTTGSGKSETIQTFILSLALKFSPDEVAFILIDYKGGGMANAFLGLPHVAGTITNLGTGDEAASDTVDPNQMRRALISIRSEIKRRQTLFNRYKVNHIDLYMRLYREHKAEEPLPHLIIISDEFAELKKEQPEFIKELVSTARVGRSLGIHLILATQKPAGIVDDEIWSNSRFKICLRVQDKQDSMGMLKRPEAAYLTQTGRAYLQIGNDEIFEMFQSGYSGAPYDPKEGVSGTAESVDMIGLDGHSLIVRQSKDSGGEKKISQLAAGVKYIAKKAAECGIRTTRPLWLPALSDKIYLDDIFAAYPDVDYRQGLYATLGLIDEPDRQQMEPLLIDFAKESNVMVAGINSSGKTTFIRTLMMSLAVMYPPSMVQFYIVDCSSRTLKHFKTIPHVGDVFYPDESEGVARTFKYAFDEIDRRTALFQKAGAGGFKEYNESGKGYLPCLVFIIDNYYELITEYPNMEEDLIRLTRDGSRYGIQFVVSVNRASDMRYKLRQNFTCSIPLRLIERGDYLDILGKNPGFVPSAVAGRGLYVNGDVFEFQTALPIYGATEAERTAAMKERFAEYAKTYEGEYAKPIPILPKNSSYMDILADQAAPLLQQGRIPVGYDVDRIELLSISTADTYCYTVWGSGRSATLNMLSNTFSALNILNYNIHFVNLVSSMQEISGSSAGCTVHSDSEGVYDLLVLLREEFKKRSTLKKSLTAEGKDVKAADIIKEYGTLAVIVDDMTEFIDIIYDPDNEEAMYPLFELFMVKGENLGIQFFFGVSGQMPAMIGARKAVKTILEYETGMVLGGMLNEQKLYQFDAYVPLGAQAKKLPDTAGYTLGKNTAVRVFVPEHVKK